jgi:hypothetical protein
MSPPIIESYRFGKITIDGDIYTKDVIIFPDQVRPNWWRQQGHSLSLEDLEEVLTAKPQVLIIGTGTFGRMQAPQETLEALKSQGIEVIIEKTEKACQVYNQRQSEGKIIAALHLTC